MEIRKSKGKKIEHNLNNNKKTTLPSGVVMTKAQKLNEQALKLVSNR